VSKSDISRKCDVKIYVCGTQNILKETFRKKNVQRIYKKLHKNYIYQFRYEGNVLAKSRSSMERSLTTTDKNTRYCKKHLIKSRQSACGQFPSAIGIEQATKRLHGVTFPVPSLGCVHIFLGIWLATCL
jgi:hypothetical protein